MYVYMLQNINSTADFSFSYWAHKFATNIFKIDFQNLLNVNFKNFVKPTCNITLRIWNEHISVSSTDIMAPALSNSPQ